MKLFQHDITTVVNRKILLDETENDTKKKMLN